MNPIEELSSHLAGGSRVIVIAERDVDLKAPSSPSRLFLLKMAEGSLASGGRGGGFGERKLVGVFLFSFRDGIWTKLFETTDEARVGEFEVPYYVSRLPLTLLDGTESMGYGVVEPELVQQMMAKAGVPSSA